MATTETDERGIDRIWSEAWNQGDMAVIDDLVAEEYVLHAPSAPQGVRGPEELKHLLRMYRQAFPDLEITVDDRISGEGKVVDRYTFRGTHEGEFMGVPATGVVSEHTGIVIHYFDDGKVVKDVVEFDTFDIMQQLGVVDRPGKA